MKVAKLDDDLVVRLPKEVVNSLHLKEGDEVVVSRAAEPALSPERAKEIEDALEAIRKLRKPLPPGWRFDREEANAR